MKYSVDIIVRRKVCNGWKLALEEHSSALCCQISIEVWWYSVLDLALFNILLDSLEDQRETMVIILVNGSGIGKGCKYCGHGCQNSTHA